jgi:Uma2 family endonuclease
MTTRRAVRFPAEDIFDAPDDDKRYEVIDGELFVSKAPDWQHQEALMNLTWYLLGYIRPRRLGRLVQAPVGVILSDDDGVQPDLVYVSREREHIIQRRGVFGAPDLLVEVLSPGTKSRDRGVKMRRYAAAGVAHYWLLDPESEALEAYRLAGDGYALVGVFGRDSVFQPELFPGLEMPIDDLWS